MSLKKTIQENLTAALQKRNETAVSTLRMLLAALSNKEIEKRTKFSKENSHAKEAELQKNSELSDEEIQQLIAGEAKKHKESIEAFQKGSRQDLVDKETKELKILEAYLPEQMSEEEVRKLVQEAIGSTGAKTVQEMGKVMSALMPKVKGKADGALVSKIVKESLQ
ncbi:MAG: GatB/YqeY domain-containing protein [Candidatus Wildermuthbacteria bacterium]|nr:GatB/YqeY domain-containing protein [Candidatus Wildermuthbacteria bacterium]